MEYFQVPESNPGSDGLCSDNSCPCGYPGATIPRGSGYMFVSDSVVDFRKDARTVAEAEAKIAKMREGMGFVVFDQDVVTSTLMCEMGAKKRGLDLEIAAADAKHWWETGQVPLRATPQAGSAEAKKEKERVAKEAAPAPKAEPAATAPPQAPAAPASAAASAKPKWWEFWK